MTANYQTRENCKERHWKIWGMLVALGALMLSAGGVIGWTATTANRADTQIQVHIAEDTQAMRALQRRFDDHAAAMGRRMDEIRADVKALRNGE